jgi:NAD(P)H-flavin reductase
LKVRSPYTPSLTIVDKVISENDMNDIKTFQLAFEDKDAAQTFKYTPGQFAEVSLLGVGECPIGIASSPVDEDFIQFTVKKVGTLTTSLHNCVEGDVVGVRGPYGNGFPMDLMEGRDVVIVGGGFAFTTLRSLTKYILHETNRKRFGNLTVIYGARSPGELIYKYDLEAWGERDDINLVVTVDKGDDSWTGKEGFVPAILKETSPSSENAVMVVCGPPIMIRFTIPIIEELKFQPENTYISLEMRMKCGIGKCGRCNIGSKYVCKDGPVFSFKELQSLPKEY